MKDISLYGHLTIDTIVDGVKERKTLGSMANVWKALLELDATLDIGLSPIGIIVICTNNNLIVLLIYCYRITKVIICCSITSNNLNLISAI